MSLLPHIRIIEFLEETVSGGTTKPMLVVGEDGCRYVLKVFSKKDAFQRSYTVAEVIANLLAKEFDLFVPKAVLMTVDSELVDSLQVNQPTIYQRLQDKKIDGFMFASFYHEGYPIYSPTNNDKLLELDEFESVLAFDLLICNDDRRKQKPNILRAPNNYLLIDHEKSFEGTEVNYQNIQKGILPHYFKHHLFYNKLKTKAKKVKNSVKFETFEDYFRNLNLNTIEDNVHFLIKNGYDEIECQNWLNYLRRQKENYSKFVSLLKEKISE